MNSNIALISLSVIVIASYLFNLLSRWSGIPSVLLLLTTGIILRYTTDITGIDYGIMNEFVKLFGTAGLIMIVLEASLDLKIRKEKLPIIIQAFFSALCILIVSSLGIATILYYMTGISFSITLIYALPLSVISSAIAIPGAEHLPEDKREFITYESSFSDILGILFFYYLISDNAFSATSVIQWGASFLLMVIGSLIISFSLLYLASKLTTQVKFFLLLAILFLMYSLGKVFHMPSLILIMIFGMILSNLDKFVHPRTTRIINIEILAPLLAHFKTITTETSFLLRTFFFILFGFTITLSSMIDPKILLPGFCIIGLLLIVRYVYFRFFLHSNLFPEIFLMPRGLITVLLFYSIPPQYSIPYIDQGILFFLIITTSILMAFGLMMFKVSSIRARELLS